MNAEFTAKGKKDLLGPSRERESEGERGSERKVSIKRRSGEREKGPEELKSSC